MVEFGRSKSYLDVESAPYYGDKNKELEGADNQFRPYFNKSLMFAEDLQAGTQINQEHLYAMRPVPNFNTLSSSLIFRV